MIEHIAFSTGRFEREENLGRYVCKEGISCLGIGKINIAKYTAPFH